jgi:thioredoxin reductase (NADPH)
MEESYSAPAAIIATGSEYRKLGAPGELEFSGKGVSYCATCDGFFFRDQPIVVVGGGDSAVEEALFLSRFGSKVYLVHRRGELRASKIMSERALANPKIELVWNSSVVRVNGNEKVTSVTLQNVETGEERDLPASGVFIAIGADPRTTLFTKQLELDDAGYLVVEGRSSRTNLPGVFAAGDVVDRVYRQAITAAAAGCTAAIDAEHFLTSLPDLH